jgi:hypothetical protein
MRSEAGHVPAKRSHTFDAAPVLHYHRGSSRCSNENNQSGLGGGREAQLPPML